MEALQQRVANGKLNAPEKIGAAAAAILARNHGHRYYRWSCEDGVFRFFEHPVHFVREQAYESNYIIQTEQADLSAVESVRVYKELSEVERAFSSLKEVIEMRPIHHRTADRVQAHIFVASLALLIHRAIEKKLNRPGSTSRRPKLFLRSSLCASSTSRSPTAASNDASRSRPNASPPSCARSASLPSSRQPRRRTTQPFCRDKPPGQNA